MLIFFFFLNILIKHYCKDEIDFTKFKVFFDRRKLNSEVNEFER